MVFEISKKKRLPGNWAFAINFGFWCDRESRFSHRDYWAVYLGLWVDLSHWGLFSCLNTKIFRKGHSALWKWSSPGKAGCPVWYLGTKGAQRVNTSPSQLRAVEGIPKWLENAAPCPRRKRRASLESSFREKSTLRYPLFSTLYKRGNYRFQSSLLPGQSRKTMKTQLLLVPLMFNQEKPFCAWGFSGQSQRTQERSKGQQSHLKNGQGVK